MKMGLHLIQTASYKPLHRSKVVNIFALFRESGKSSIRGMCFTVADRVQFSQIIHGKNCPSLLRTITIGYERRQVLELAIH